MYRFFLSVLLMVQWKIVAAIAQKGALGVVSGTSSPQFLEEGQKIEFICRVSGSTTPTFKWYHKDTQIGLDPYSFEDGFSKKDYSQIEDGKTFYHSKISKYSIIKSDTGEYTCVVQNKHSQVNKTIHLYVQEKKSPYSPEVTAVNDRVTVQPFSNVTLSCNVKYVSMGYTFPQWNFENNSIHSDWHRIIQFNYLKKKDKKPGTMNMNLTIINVTEGDLGNYQCEVISNIGHGMDMIQLAFVPVQDVSSQAAKGNNPNTPKKDKVLTLAVSCLGAFAACVLLLLLFFYDRRRRRKIRYKRRSLRNSNGSEFEFDIFLSFSKESGEFVQDYLIPLLEGSPYNLKVCFHHRDFELGKDITENMADAVYNSRKVLVVISDGYLNSNFCKFEMDVALRRELEENFPCLALICLTTMTKKLPHKIKTKNFLDLSNNQEWKFIDKRLKSFLTDLCSEQIEMTTIVNVERTQCENEIAVQD